LYRATETAYCNGLILGEMNFKCDVQRIQIEEDPSRTKRDTQM